MAVYGKVAKIKAELSKKDIKKSGFNKYANFNYYELADFLPHINDLNAQYGVCDILSINKEECSLTLVDVDEPESNLRFSIPYAEAEMLGKGGAKSSVDTIQRAGATLTYLRRYLYITAYNVVESEMVDAAPNKTKITKEENDKTKRKIINRLKQNYPSEYQEILDDTLIQTGYMKLDDVDFNEINIKDFSDIIMKVINERKNDAQKETVEKVNQNKEGMF